MVLYYKGDDGHNKTDGHINTVKLNGAKLQQINLSYVNLTKFPDCHLQLLKHPDIINITVEVENY